MIVVSGRDSQSEETRLSTSPFMKSNLSYQEIASFITHEFGNPISSIKGFLDIVLEGRVGPLSPMQHEFLSLAGTSANRLSYLLDDLSDLGLIIKGDFQLEIEETSLRQVVSKVVDQLNPLATSRQITLKNLFSDESIYSLDKKRVTRVIFHLINHVIRFALAGSKLAISSEVKRERTILYVQGQSDTIPAEYIASLWEPSTGDASTLKKWDAMVLGIAMAKYVVKRHEGEMWLEKQPEGVMRTCLSMPTRH